MDSGVREDDAPDVVITGTAALAEVGQELAAPRAAGELVLVGPAAGPAGGSPAEWRVRTVPAGAELSGDAGTARGENR